MNTNRIQKTLDLYDGKYPYYAFFDLGGVLVEFTGLRDMKMLLRIPLSENDIRRRWASCPATKAFETGQIPARQFARRFVKEWDLVVTPDAFLEDSPPGHGGFYQEQRNCSRPSKTGSDRRA